MDDVVAGLPVEARSSVLLLSGGIDSAAIACWRKPDLAIFIDYGQRPSSAERSSAAAVAQALELRFEEIAVDTAAIGSGLLSGAGRVDDSPSEEWWPFRNQMLVSFAAAWLIRVGLSGSEVLVGSVRPDRDRHLDGGPRFYEILNSLLQAQEGDIAVQAPAIDLSTEELVLRSGIEDAVLGWTHSCHVADRPCLACPGCYKREQVLENLGRLQ